MAVTQETYKSLLKVAQIYNCLNKNYPHEAKIVKSILEKEGDINQVIPASVLPHPSKPVLRECTILHMAAIEGDIETFKILLDNGADFTSQNQHGCTILHNLLDWESNYSKDEFVNSVLLAHVKFANSSNPCNGNGISHFHIACMVNNIQTVQFFLEHAVSVHQVVSTNSLRFPGWSPLHFAVEGCSIETVKMLLKNHADITLKDSRGKRPLHSFLERKLQLFESLSESKDREMSNLILEKIDRMDDITNLLLQDDDADDVGLSQFHVACTMQDTSLAEYFIEQAVIDINHHVKFDSPVWPGYTSLHFAAHCNMKIFKLLVQKGAMIEAKNAEELTPLDICFKKCKPEDLVFILKLKAEWRAAKFSDGKTELIELVAAMCDPLQFFRCLEFTVDDINTCVVENPPFWKGFTPLHFAVLSSKDTDTELIRLCLDRGADVTAQDTHGWTPIHLAFRTSKIEVTILLLQHHRSTDDLIDEEGLSLQRIVQQLIRLPSAVKLGESLTRWSRGDDVFEEVGSSWLHAASYSGDSGALNRRSTHFKNIDAVVTCSDPTIFWSRYRGYTPLHLVIERASSALAVDFLLQNEANIFAVRPDGLTPVYAVLRDVSNDYLMNRFLWRLETCNDSKVRLTELSGITMLHVACRTFNVAAARILIEEGCDVNARVQKDCPIWSEYTPLHVLMWYAVYIQDQDTYEDFQALLGLLLAKGADVTAVNGDGDTPVHLSFDHCINDINDYNFVNTSLLMDHHGDFSVNPVNAKKISHFHAACIVNNVEAVEKFLNHGVNVNQPIDFFFKNFAGESPLHLALKRILSTGNHLVTIDLLLSHGADVLAEDSYGYTVLHRAACDYSQHTELLQKLISFGADVSAKNIFGETPMEFLLKVDQISLTGMEVLLKSGCRLNTCNPISEEGYLSMIIDDNYHKATQTKAFERMITASDLFSIDEMSRTALHNIVSTCKVNCDFVCYDEIVYQFGKLGIDLDYQDISGKTALHLASKFGNVQAIAALIDAGADVNVVDFSNKTALSYALELSNPDEYHRDNVIKVLVVHIRKLQLLGFSVSQLNEHLLEGNHLNMSFDIQDLLNDIKIAREEVVDTQPQLVLDDFLLETEALATYPFKVDSKRKMVEEQLKLVGEKRVELKSMLMLQYRKALKRVIA